MTRVWKKVKMGSSTLEVILVSVCLLTVTHALMCDRRAGMTVPKTHGLGKFEVIIQGSPKKYVPGGVYIVEIKGHGDSMGMEKFTRFLLVAEPAPGNAGQASAGKFEPKDDSLARMSEFCPNAVKQASDLPKSDVQVFWTAPPASTRCVIFRATVIKNNHQWYMDDEKLTRKLCLDEAHEGETGRPCTACDEAKYELTFESVWSSLTHPRGFPSNIWADKFSDIIGASHHRDFRLWEYGKPASPGLQQLAEMGDSRTLEAELKDQSEKIRTIIKARGLRYTNFNGLKTFAVFRVDKNHNLVSLVSKIEPSPDWFVGISAINLCGSNGTWLLNKEIELFPIDAGTDSGITYLSEDAPMHPRSEIQLLVSSANPDSPFNDPLGTMLQPFAKLRIQQQRTYKRGSCEEPTDPDESSNDYDDDEFEEDSPDRHRKECVMHDWGQWSPCTTTCGKGSRTRMRSYVNEARAKQFGCQRPEIDKTDCDNPQSCRGTVTGHSPGSSVDDSTSRITPFEQFNSNNVDNRTPYSREPRPTITGGGLAETPRKYANKEETGVLSQNVDPGCKVTDWGVWQPCSVTCGKGVKTRSRVFVIGHYDHQKCNVTRRETAPCTGVETHCPQERTTDNFSNVPKKTRHPRPMDESSMPYNQYTAGNDPYRSGTYSGVSRDHGQWQGYAPPRTSAPTLPHRIPSHQRPRSGPYQPPYSADGPSVDCKLSPWSRWSSCSVTCGRGWKFQSRYVEVFNENGGRPCAPLEQSRRCKGTNCPRYSSNVHGASNTMTDDYYNYQD